MRHGNDACILLILLEDSNSTPMHLMSPITFRKSTDFIVTIHMSYSSRSIDLAWNMMTSESSVDKQDILSRSSEICKCSFQKNLWNVHRLHHGYSKCYIERRSDRVIWFLHSWSGRQLGINNNSSSINNKNSKKFNAKIFLFFFLLLLLL